MVVYKRIVKYVPVGRGKRKTRGGARRKSRSSRGYGRWRH